MNMYEISLNGLAAHLGADRTLWLPELGVLCISDLHLGKSERLARRSGLMLPPYEIDGTLERLEAAVDRLGPKVVICLGDSFDDLDAALSLPEPARLWLARLQAGRDWIWIEGNHDPGPVDIGGRHLAEVAFDGVYFCHIATEAERIEVSGHYHPKARVPGVGPARPAFVWAPPRLIMPAFGTYTGGLAVTDPAISALCHGQSLAVLTGKRVIAVPVQV